MFGTVCSALRWRTFVFCSPTVVSRLSEVTLGAEGMWLGKKASFQRARWAKSPSQCGALGVSSAPVSKNKSNKSSRWGW